MTGTASVEEMRKEPVDCDVLARAVKTHLISCEHIELTLEESAIETEEKCTLSELGILFSRVQLC